MHYDESENNVKTVLFHTVSSDIQNPKCQFQVVEFRRLLLHFGSTSSERISASCSRTCSSEEDLLSLYAC